MNTVICSHGFGVKADGRGMFTDIEQSLPNVRFVMFDYNTFDADGNTIVPSLDEQAQKLQKVISSNPAGATLLCHSQGSIVAGLVDLTNITKVILLAPPVKMSMQRIIEKMMNKQGSVIDLKGVSKLPRSDGSVTLLPKAYVESLKNRDPIDIYASIAAKKPTTILRSLRDEVVGLTNVDEVKHAKIIDVDGDHNYTGPSRDKLIEILKSEISS